MISLAAQLSRATSPRAASKPDHVRSILVVRLDLLGDLIFTMPAVGALRQSYPQAHITLLTLPYTGDLARMYQEVDRVITVDTNAIRSPGTLFRAATRRDWIQAIRDVRAVRYDMAISVSGRMASLWTLLSGASWTVGYRDEAYGHTLDRELVGGRYRERMHETDYGLALAREADSSALSDWPSPIVADAVLKHAQNALHEAGLPEGARYVALHPGAGAGSAKRWPHAHWGSLVEQLVADPEFDLWLVVVGGPDDMALGLDLVARGRGRAITVCGKTVVPTLAAVLLGARAVVSSDSGPLHLATALGTPSVGLYGPTDPQVYAPRRPGTASHVLRAGIACSPCYRATGLAECPFGDPICMRLITSGDVIAALRAPPVVPALVEQPASVVAEGA